MRLVAPRDSPATSLWAMRPPLDPSTIVVVVGGSIGRAGIPALCRRVHTLLENSDAETVVCDVAALADTDVVAVDALARIQLTARRLGRSVRLRGACPELRDLLAFMGLADVVPALSLEAERQPKERKEFLGVEKEANPGDLSP